MAELTPTRGYAELTPEQAAFLARGYAWGHADGVAGHVTNGSTLEGIEFGAAYAKHVANGNGSRMSVQRAYGMWKETGTLPNV